MSRSKSLRCLVKLNVENEWNKDDTAPDVPVDEDETI